MLIIACKWIEGGVPKLVCVMGNHAVMVHLKRRHHGSIVFMHKCGAIRGLHVSLAVSHYDLLWMLYVIHGGRWPMMVVT